MKKLVELAAMLSIISASCSKVEDFEGERPDVRLAAELSAYYDQLSSASNGWLGYLYPEGGGGYTFKFKFDRSNRVSMTSDINATYAATAKESSYRLRATQIPSLYFDTYNYLHHLADPDPRVSGGSAGMGLLSDFEFSIISASADTFRLKGNLHGSELLLIRAADDQGDDFISKAYAYNEQISKLNRFPYYYNKFVIAGKEYNFTLNTDKNTVSFYSSKNGFTRFTTEYASLANGITLREPFMDGEVLINSLTNFDIDQTQHTATVSTGQATASISNEATPLQVDPEAATRMYIQPYTYTSDHGFTVNGIEDGQGLSAIPGFIGIAYVPRQFIDGYDIFRVFYEQGRKNYGPVIKTQLGSEGKMYFNNHVAYNGTNPEEPGVTIIANFSTQLISPGGYYVFQTGTNYFDLVSVTDPDIWIRFY